MKLKNFASFSKLEQPRTILIISAKIRNIIKKFLSSVKCGYVIKTFEIYFKNITSCYKSPCCPSMKTLTTLIANRGSLSEEVRYLSSFTSPVKRFM